MPNELTYHTIAAAFNIGLNRPRDIRNTISGNRRRNTFVERLFRYVHQLLRSHPTAAYCHGQSRITDKIIVPDTNIQTDNIAKAQFTFAGQSVNNLFIHRNTNITRILATGDDVA